MFPGPTYENFMIDSLSQVSVRERLFLLADICSALAGECSEHPMHIGILQNIGLNHSSLLSLAVISGSSNCVRCKNSSSSMNWDQFKNSTD